MVTGMPRLRSPFFSTGQLVDHGFVEYRAVRSVFGVDAKEEGTRDDGGTGSKNRRSLGKHEQQRHVEDNGTCEGARHVRGCRDCAAHAVDGPPAQRPQGHVDGGEQASRGNHGEPADVVACCQSKASLTVPDRPMTSCPILVSTTQWAHVCRASRVVRSGAPSRNRHPVVASASRPLSSALGKRELMYRASNHAHKNPGPTMARIPVLL